MLKKICFTISSFLISFQINAAPPPYITSTSNQQLVADQLQSIVNPNEEQTSFLNQLNLLDLAAQQLVFSQMSGQQYTTLFLSAEITNRQFLRRLYDPIRPIVSNPQSCEDDVYEICSADGIDAWVESSVSRNFLNGNKNAQGFKMSGYDVSGGAQKRLSSTWTLGASIYYAINHFHYNVGGSSKSNTVLGGIYTLYRPTNFYFLSDITFGYFTNDLHRRVRLVEKTFDFIAKSRPSVSQIAYYGELGMDYSHECVLIQPFIGIEVNRFKRDCKHDNSLGMIKLNYNKKDVTNAYSRLGIHFTIPENRYDIIMAFDLAWQYRLTSAHNSLSVGFANYGQPFTITGVPDERNSLSIAYTVWSEIFENCKLYLEASGERWKRVSCYDFTIGLIFKW